MDNETFELVAGERWGERCRFLGNSQKLIRNLIGYEQVKLIYPIFTQGQEEALSVVVFTSKEIWVIEQGDTDKVKAVVHKIEKVIKREILCSIDSDDSIALEIHLNDKEKLYLNSELDYYGAWKSKYRDYVVKINALI